MAEKLRVLLCAALITPLWPHCWTPASSAQVQRVPVPLLVLAPVGRLRRALALLAALMAAFRAVLLLGLCGLARLFSVAADADGDVLLAWNSVAQDGDGDGVYQRRFVGPAALDLSAVAAASPARS